MNIEQIAIWIFALTAAHIYQFLKGLLGLEEKAALWGLFAYALVVSTIATLIGGGLPPVTSPLAFLEWLGTHMSPIIAISTLLYKGFGKTNKVGEYIPGLAISRMG